MRLKQLQEGYKVLPNIDRERYTELPGLEGPFRTLSGKVVYYDPKEGSYYDRDTDMYLSYDEFKALDNDYSGMKDERNIPVKEVKLDDGLSAAAGAVISRLYAMGKMESLLQTYGLDEVEDAIANATGFWEEGDEIGSSDVSAWANDVLNYLGGMEEAKKPRSFDEAGIKTAYGTTKTNRYGGSVSSDEKRIIPKRGTKAYAAWMAKNDARRKAEIEKWKNEAVELDEATAKIACLKCDEVSTAKAWEKNHGFCPKCKTSSQGVAESTTVKEGGSQKHRDKALATINARITKPGQPPKHSSYDSAPDDIKTAVDKLASQYKKLGEGTIAGTVRRVKDMIAKGASKMDVKRMFPDMSDDTVNGFFERFGISEGPDAKHSNPAMKLALDRIDATFSPERRAITDQISAMVRTVTMLADPRWANRAWANVEEYGITDADSLKQEMMLMLDNEKKLVKDNLIGMSAQSSVAALEKALAKL